MKLPIFRAVLLLLINALSLGTWAGTSSKLSAVPTQIVFQTKVDTPTHLSLCKGQLWTFSVSNQKLVSINPQTGQVSGSYSLSGSDFLSPPHDIAALTCRGNHLVVLVNKNPVSKIVEYSIGPSSLLMAAHFQVPEKTRATDLICGQDSCVLLQGDIFLSKDLVNWKALPLQNPKALTKSQSRIDVDPFDDWQASLVVAKGAYTRGAINSVGELAFLDPFLAQVVVQKNNKWVKWGSFGATEGNFLSPKHIHFLTEKLVVVSDAKLKSIFLYRIDGTYLGVLTSGEEEPISLDYPLGLASIKNRLFIADFRSHLIRALDLREYKTEIENTGTLTVHRNLFRREATINDGPSSLCLGCHDGTVTNHLYKYIKTKFHHPLECSECHEPHHSAKTKHFVRKAPQELCESCHKDYQKAETNHVWPLSNKKGGRCVECHRSHTDNDKLLIKPNPSLCLDCHQDFAFKHKAVEDLAIIEKAKGIVMHQGALTCQTCHQTHINWKDSHFIKEPAPVISFCSSCHGDKSPRLFKEFHKAIKTKKGPNR